ncbi:hypothetical protein NliqN6_1449 [Naganishia liquefaciens]|uniref:Yeast cell wall synthesis Kre9/Knh1-like N-terminal domain-containing protein n=1 Tax=Naganishia liquefaciens TaxID=104408 RepID=A0A8H3YEA3_9TREE|nr:hypothetical protein NliqN6_1449 [Naganishia liquefaciens]
MVSFKALAASVVAASLAVSGALAELSIVSPSSEIFWVGNSSNTLRWLGTDPKQFTVFLNNPDTNLLTSKIALFSVVDSYNTALTVQPVQRAGDNYVIELTNILNSSDIYATSQPFSIKQQGALYPTATTATSPLEQTGTAAVGASTSGGSSASAGASGTTSARTTASSAAASPSSGATQNAVIGGGIVMAIAGAALNLF